MIMENEMRIIITIIKQFKDGAYYKEVFFVVVYDYTGKHN